MYEKIINSTNNKQHKFILALLFKLRLTTGQVINLQVRDIQNNMLYSRGKRYWIPDSLMHDFYKFMEGKEAKNYLLYSNRNKKYSIRSIQEIKKKALKKCGHKHLMKPPKPKNKHLSGLVLVIFA